MAAAGARVARPRRQHTDDRRRCGRRHCAPQRSESASTGRDRSPSCSARRGSCSRPCRPTPPTRTARVHAFCHARARRLARDGRDALTPPGRCAGCETSSRPDTPFDDAASRRRRAGSPGAEGLIFLPYLAGERTPHADPDARGAFVGLSLRHDRGALVRAVLEGVAYGLRDSLELLRELGVDVGGGRVSGGGARSRLWLEIVASVLGSAARARPPSRKARRTARRCSRGVAGGVFATSTTRSRAACASATPSSRDADWARAYAEGYARFTVALYPALEAWRIDDGGRMAADATGGSSRPPTSTAS